MENFPKLGFSRYPSFQRFVKLHTGEPITMTTEIEAIGALLKWFGDNWINFMPEERDSFFSHLDSTSRLIWGTLDEPEARAAFTKFYRAELKLIHEDIKKHSAV